MVGIHNIPDHHQNTISTLIHSHSLHSCHVLSPVFLPLKVNRPLPVIPYQRHMNEKHKVAESPQQSGIMPDAADRNKTDSLSHLPVDISFNLTPPDTPRSAASAEQSSPDQMSPDNKEPGYASITFREVATGNSGIRLYKASMGSFHVMFVCACGCYVGRCVYVMGGQLSHPQPCSQWWRNGEGG